MTLRRGFEYRLGSPPKIASRATNKVGIQTAEQTITNQVVQLLNFKGTEGNR
jgi:hypothetical protein